MAKHFDLWSCDHCHETFGTEKEALDCEKSHMAIVKMEPHYDILSDLQSCPDAIVVHFSDGSHKHYYSE